MGDLKRLFLSHISEEATLARALKKCIEGEFSKQCAVFVSSDTGDIPLGNEWLKSIDTELSQSGAFIVLCSPVSIRRPWINFEAGCGFIKKVPVIVVCHSGQKKGGLPMPISRFQALELEDEGAGNALLSALAGHLKMTSSGTDARAIQEELLKVAATLHHGKPNLEKKSAYEGEILPEEQEVLNILKSFPESESLPPSELAHRISMPEQRIRLFLERLLKKGLVHDVIIFGGPKQYSLNDKGREYLFDKGLL